MFHAGTVGISDCAIMEQLKRMRPKRSALQAAILPPLFTKIIMTGFVSEYEPGENRRLWRKSEITPLSWSAVDPSFRDAL